MLEKRNIYKQFIKENSLFFHGLVAYYKQSCNLIFPNKRRDSKGIKIL